MTILRSILLLSSVCLFMAMPYAIGHALAAHNRTAILVGLLAGAAGILLFFLQTRGREKP
ncbi:MAG: hypothetical protein ACRENP_07925 [Longimicrobiales bacterium]